MINRIGMTYETPIIIFYALFAAVFFYSFIYRELFLLSSGVKKKTAKHGYGLRFSLSCATSKNKEEKKVESVIVIELLLIIHPAYRLDVGIVRPRVGYLQRVLYLPFHSESKRGRKGEWGVAEMGCVRDLFLSLSLFASLPVSLSLDTASGKRCERGKKGGRGGGDSGRGAAKGRGYALESLQTQPA